MPRTTGQLHALGARVAAGGADSRTVPVVVDAVAVFVASDFPLTFGVTGGDMASAAGYRGAKARLESRRRGGQWRGC
ncbi:hypothetical protein [Streptomyces sp. NRRL F-5630]|uniref:hypothetical protein n=1 Tax=Streptomyces sp. NRRL F-5630 TaxID=1463864 RepID=UPI003D70243D